MSGGMGGLGETAMLKTTCRLALGTASLLIALLFVATLTTMEKPDFATCKAATRLCHDNRSRYR